MFLNLPQSNRERSIYYNVLRMIGASASYQLIDSMILYFTDKLTGRKKPIC